MNAVIERTLMIDLKAAESPHSNILLNQANVESVAFIFKIFDGGKEIDYSLFETVRLTLSASGRVFYNGLCTVDLGRGCVLHVLEPEALSRVGRVQGQLDLTGKLYGREINLATPHFDFTVPGSLANMPEAERKVYINEIAVLTKEIKLSAEAAAKAFDEAFEIRNSFDKLLAGGQLNFPLIAQKNNDFATPQVRNITYSQDGIKEGAPLADGVLCIVYE